MVMKKQKSNSSSFVYVILVLLLIVGAFSLVDSFTGEASRGGFFGKLFAGKSLPQVQQGSSQGLTLTQAKDLPGLQRSLSGKQQVTPAEYQVLQQWITTYCKQHPKECQVVPRGKK